MMFTTEEDALQWYDAHADEARVSAEKVFRKYFEHERKIKKQGGKVHLESWHWETRWARCWQMAKEDPLVKAVSAKLRINAQPYRLERYDDRDHFERLLDQFDKAIYDVREASCRKTISRRSRQQRRQRAEIPIRHL